MDEAEWLMTENVQAMIDLITAAHSRHGEPALVSFKKIRLFECAVCRHVWDAKNCRQCGGLKMIVLPYNEDTEGGFAVCDSCGATGRTPSLTNGDCRDAVKVAEHFIDGQVGYEAMREFRETLPNLDHPDFAQMQLVINCCMADGWRQAGVLCEVASYHFKVPVRELADILRDVIGNPFRDHDYTILPVPSLAAQTAVDMAKTIYNNRAYERLPILADALEDAGCGKADVLDHLRLLGTHVRGCWALDVVAGNKR